MLCHLGVFLAVDVRMYIGVHKRTILNANLFFNIPNAAVQSYCITQQ